MTDVGRPRLNVLIVDDSAVVRQTLSAILADDPGFDVQSAADPIIAEQKMAHFVPDVIVLDLEMPRMDGLTFLRKLMAERPTPVVVCSSYAEDGSEAALRALELGAVDILPKPRVGVREFLHESSVMVIESVRGAAMAQLGGGRAGVPASPPAPAGHAGPVSAPGGRSPSPAPVPQRHTADVVMPPAPPPELGLQVDPVIAVGASTGGTEALRSLLDAMPEDGPAILIVQHMPVGFTNTFAKRLAKSARMVVREAASGDAVMRGHALIARGDRHMVLRRQGSHCHVDLVDGPLVARHRPSVDVLFRSVAQAVGRRAVGLIMTGMGDDGAAGLLEMRQAGAVTFAQDEASSVVFGMPREAIARGGVSAVLALDELAPALVHAAQALPDDRGQRRRSS